MSVTPRWIVAPCPTFARWWEWVRTRARCEWLGVHRVYYRDGYSHCPSCGRVWR